MRLTLALVATLSVACGAAGPAPTQQARTATPSPVLIATVAPNPTLDPKASASAGVGLPSPGTQGGPVAQQGQIAMFEFPVGRGQGPHDVAPAPDGGVWYTAQRTGELGYLDPNTGKYTMTKLGQGSSPHGVIVGPDGNAWVTDSGLNAIVRVDAVTREVTRFPLGGPNVNLNTAAFDLNGTLWFTGQSGYYGYLRAGAVKVMPSPRGPGPYGIDTCPDGGVFYSSLAGSHIAQVNIETGAATPIDSPTRNQGARRVWCDSRGNVWVSEWNAGQVGVYRREPLLGDASVKSWREWRLPGSNPMTYAVYVDDEDIVWLTDFGANAIVRFDPKTETFTSLPHSAPNAAVRQLLGRPGEVWGAMSGQDKLLLIRTR